jgi:hypothetical protein
MDKYWKVITRKGNRMNLECGAQRKEILCPTRPYAKELFLMIRPGQVVENSTVELLEKAR